MLSAITKNSTIPICKVTSFQDNTFSWFGAVFFNLWGLGGEESFQGFCLCVLKTQTSVSFLGHG